jgi:hypothetical protein
MGDMPFRYKMIRYGIGEVILKSKDTGLLKLEKIYSARDKNFPRNSVLQLRANGTDFVCHNFEIPIYIQDLQQYAISLLLTAAHCVSNPVTMIENEDIFECGFQVNNMNLKAIYLTSFLDKFPQQLISSNGWSYCLNGDIAILVLLSEDSSLSPHVFELESENTSSSNASLSFICGFPDLSDAVFDFMHSYNTPDPNTVKDQVKSAFYYGQELIISEGQARESNDLIEISCSSYVGMSGSPIISSNKIQGVFVGGPPMPGQIEALQISRLIENECPLEANTLLQDCIVFDQYYNKPLFYKIYEKPQTKFLICFILNKKNIPPPNQLKNLYNLAMEKIKNKKDLKRKIERLKICVIANLVKLTYLMTSSIKNKELLSFNTGIKLSPQVTESLKKIIQNSKKFLQTSPNSMELTEELLENF